MAKHVGSQLVRPGRKPPVDLQAQRPPHGVRAHPAAPVQLMVEPFRGQQRRVGISPVRAALVADLGQPPVDQLGGAVDRRHQTRLRAAAVSPFPEPDVQLAEPTQVRAPVTDVEHHRLVDPQTKPTPQRGGEVVPRGGQVLACLGDRETPLGEQGLDLDVRRWHPDLAQRHSGLTVELIDRLRHHHTGHPMDLPLVTADHELVEQRQRASLACPGAHGMAKPPLLGQKPVGVLTGRLPQRAGHRPGELDDDRPSASYVPVAQTGRRHRQCVLIDDLLLEVLNQLRGPQHLVRAGATPHRNQAHQSLSSCTSIMRRPYRRMVTQADHSSTVGLRGANRRLPADTALNLARRRNEPESREIAA